MTKNKKEPAIVFVGFKHKSDSPKAARDLGFKAVLIALDPSEKSMELFDDVYVTNVKDSAEVLKVIEDIKSKYRTKGVLTNYEQYVVLRSYIAEHLGVPSASVYASSCTRNKALQRHALGFLPENIPSKMVDNLAEAKEAWKQLGKDVFVKNISGIKSKLIFHCKSEEDIEEAVDAILKENKIPDKDLYDAYEYMKFHFKYPNPNNTFLVEKTAKGMLVSIDSIVGSRKIWHTPSLVDNYRAKEFGINDSYLPFRILPSKLDPEIISKAKEVVTGSIRILGLRNCSVHTELMIDGDDIYFIEIASRMGGYRQQMYEFAYGLNLSEFLIKAVVGKEKSSRKSKAKIISYIEIFPVKEGEFVGFTGLDEFKETYKDNIVKPNVNPKLNICGPAKLGYGPVAVISLTGKNYKEVYQASEAAVKGIKVIVK